MPYDFRNKGGSTYRTKMEKRRCCCSVCFFSSRRWCCQGLAIADAQEEQAEELRGTTGASFSVERDVSTGGWTTDSHGTYSTQDFITEDMIQEIASVEGITAYDASIISMPALYTESGMELPSKNVGILYLWFYQF